jgi:hypothetical protein
MLRSAPCCGWFAQELLECRSYQWLPERPNVLFRMPNWTKSILLHPAGPSIALAGVFLYSQLKRLKPKKA